MLLFHLLHPALMIALAEGASQFNRIVTGTRTTIQKHPYHVSLESSGLVFCGGAIISKHHIITAGHCVVSKSAQEIQVRVGSSQFGSGGKTVVLSDININPYMTLDASNDIAILTTAQKIPFSKDVSAAKLPKYYQHFKAGAPLTVTGFGAVSRSSFNYQHSVVLLEAQVNLVDETECRAAYANVHVDITADKICVGFPADGNNACVGDSGSPVVSRKGILVGVVSWGGVCHEWSTPTVISSVGAARAFIESVADV